MGWCPVCRSEYEAWVTECPNCRAELVAVLPPVEKPAKRIRPADQESPLAARLGAAVLAGARFLRPSWQLIRRATRLARQDTRLVLVIVALSTLSSANSLVTDYLRFSRGPRVLAVSPGRGTAPVRDQRREGRGVGGVVVSLVVVRVLPGIVFAPLQTTATCPSLAGWTGLVYRPPSAPVRLWPPMLWWIAVWMSDYPIRLLIVVGLLGWLADRANGLAPRRFRDYVRLHYLPVIIMYFCLTLALVVTTGPLLYFTRDFSTSQWGAAAWFWVTFLPLALLTLAPFAIVGRGLGAWGGAKVGVALLWRNRVSLLGVFALGWLAQEALRVLTMAVPPLQYVWVSSPERPLAILHWPVRVALALVGLWLAAAFTLVVRREEIVPPAERAAA